MHIKVSIFLTFPVRKFSSEMCKNSSYRKVSQLWSKLKFSNRWKLKNANGEPLENTKYQIMPIWPKICTAQQNAKICK